MVRSYTRPKNYSTTISIDKTVAEIEKILSIHGAKRIMKQYDQNGIISMVAFTVDTPQGEMPVKLPARVNAMLNVFKVGVNAKVLPKRMWNDYEQAARTAWRTVKDWIDAQMALVAVEMVKVEEIFLPYVYDERLNQTLFEAIESRKIDLSRMLNAAKLDEDEPACIDAEILEDSDG